MATLAMLFGASAVFADTTSTPANSANLDLSVNVVPVIAIRTLDSTATDEISALNFDMTPTATGIRNTQRTVVDVSTSNVSGYVLYMQSDYRTDGTSSSAIPGGNDTSTADFTTSLINTDNTIYTANPTSASIPTANTTTASGSSYWNYSKSWNETLGTTGNTNDYSSASLSSSETENLVIPVHGTPDTLRGDVDIATAGSETNVDVNVNIATDKVSGSYQNRLLFTAIANPIPVDYTLTFNKNTTDVVNDLPEPLTDTVVAASKTFTIPDVSGNGTLPAMTRAGYQFAGWSTDASTRQGSGSGPNGLYVAGDTYTVVADEQTQPDYGQYGTGSATLYAFWDVEYNYTLNFSCGDDATGCPTRQTDTTTATSKTFTIPADAPEKEGFVFVNYTDNGEGSGNEYDPGDTITLTSSANTKTLTANWEEDASDFWGITTMQEMTPEICASVHYPNNTTATNTNYLVTDKATYESKNITSDGSTYWVPTRTLVDDRDADGNGTKKSYTVSRLADGNCWMTQNLEYDLLSLYNNGKRGIGSKNDGSTFEMTDANLASGVAGYYTTTANEYNYVINPNTKKLTNITRNSYIGNVTGQTEYYYNWTGATAGQGSQSNTSGTIDGSICPAGWRLPTNYTDTANQNISWSALTNAYLNITTNTSTTTGYQTLEQYPISLYRAGYVSSGSQGTAANGYYWSSTANNANVGYYLYYSTSDVYPQNGGNKYRGFQVRCVASR